MSPNFFSGSSLNYLILGLIIILAILVLILIFRNWLENKPLLRNSLGQRFSLKYGLHIGDELISLTWRVVTNLDKRTPTIGYLHQETEESYSLKIMGHGQIEIKKDVKITSKHKIKVKGKNNRHQDYIHSYLPGTTIRIPNGGSLFQEVGFGRSASYQHLGDFNEINSDLKLES